MKKNIIKVSTTSMKTNATSMKVNITKISIPLIVVLLATNCGPSKNDIELQNKAKTMFGTLPDKMPGAENDTPQLISLGKNLYSEKALSINNTQSCASCHKLETNGVDNLKTSPGAFNKNGDRNSPSVYNAGYHFAQFWDGRAATLEEQAKGPILNPIEMGMKSEKDVVAKISKLSQYPTLFQQAFPSDKNPITYNNIAKAIASFERTLRTRDRLDDFINGDLKALSQEEKKGLRVFINSGCTACHNGSLLGARLYQKMGVMQPYSNTVDVGRFKVTKNEADKYVFKVPSLRNIANTAPYFHDGAATTLEEAIQTMSTLQLGATLGESQVKSIVTFLQSLSNKNEAKN